MDLKTKQNSITIYIFQQIKERLKRKYLLTVELKNPLYVIYEMKSKYF